MSRVAKPQLPLFEFRESKKSPSELFLTGPKTTSPAIVPYNPQSIYLEIEEQLELLRFCCQLDIGKRTLPFMKKLMAHWSLPDEAEAWAVIPNWRRLDRNLTKAIHYMLWRLARVRSISRLFPLDPGTLFRQTYRSRYFLDRLFRWQRSNFAVLPVQFGARHIGRSLASAQKHPGKYLETGEFGLGIVGTIALLLTTPIRLQTESDLGLVAFGDECDCDERGRVNNCEYGTSGHHALKIACLAPDRLELTALERHSRDRQAGLITGFYPRHMRE